MTVFNGIGIAVVYYGAGKHIQNVSTADLAKWFKVCDSLSLKNGWVGLPLIRNLVILCLHMLILVHFFKRQIQHFVDAAKSVSDP